MFTSVLRVLIFTLAAIVSASAVARGAPDVSPAPTVAGSVNASHEQIVKVNINTADAETLQRELIGVGAVKAKAIVAYRNEHGSFATTDELLEVKGIGVSIFERNREALLVE